MNYKRRIFSIFVSLIFVVLCGCNALPERDKVSVKSGFSVNYIDVLEGDCFFIRLPDGKNLLIDTGEKNAVNSAHILNYLKAYNVDKIDYMVLSNPHARHIGNAVTILENFSVSTLYMPLIFKNKLEYFPEFNEVLQLIENKNIATEISELGKIIKGENYEVCFLAPLPLDMSDSSYEGINGTVIPDERAMKNVSAVMYMNIDGVRFLFTGDISAKNERDIVSDYKSGLYNVIFKKKGINVKLENIDFLKISDHGDEDSSCNEFISLLNPLNAVISVGGDNYKGHPATAVLERLSLCSSGCNILRTDVHGNIVVYRENGLLKIDTDVN